VRDASGHLVPNLTKDDFAIVDDGQPAAIVAFSNEPVPVTVALMLDLSNSMAGDYLQVRAAARAFVDQLGPRDRAVIGTFGAEVAVSPLLTNDKTVLKRVVDEELWPGGGTPLWSGVRAGMQAVAAQPPRRVVLVLTDGGDACPVPGSDRPEYDSNTGVASALCAAGSDVERQAVLQEVMVYAIQFEGDPPPSAGSVWRLTDMVDETGGGRFRLEAKADLAATFSQVIEELHHQYAIGFVPHVRDGNTHRVALHTRNAHLHVRTRRTYLAPGKS
jgi:VWFA-related protein